MDGLPITILATDEPAVPPLKHPIPPNLKPATTRGKATLLGNGFAARRRRSCLIVTYQWNDTMLRILDPQGTTLCDRINRRQWLQIGGIGLGGLTLPRLFEQRAKAGPAGNGPAKSVIILFNGGGIPHHETWDPKPDAPPEIRGDFGVIQTKVPGMLVGELMPLTAQLTDKVAVIRTMVTGDQAHSSSGYQMLTGVPHIPLSRENAKPGRPNDAPSLNALAQYLRPSRGGLPASIVLPRRMANNGGRDPWPGTDAGAMGRKYDPWFLVCNPNEKGFTVPGAKLPEGLDPLRVDKRFSLLEQVNQHLDHLEKTAAARDYNIHAERAINLLTGGKARDAFNLEKEPEKVRERYGLTKHAQSALLARRLVEAGVSLVQVNAVSEDTSRPNSGGWDTHSKHSESLKGWLMPNMDKLYSALISDLDERGMLDETLVCWVAEFGHTPRINAKAGRDHWGRVFSIAMAGGGIKGGVIHGASDAHAAYPLGDVVTPADYLATVLHCMGYEPETPYYDMQGRPIPISRGEPVKSILA